MERRAKTLDSFIFTGVLKTEKQKLFDQQVTGIRGTTSAKNIICRKSKDEERDVFLKDYSMQRNDTVNSLEEYDRLTPNEEENLETKFEKLDTTEIQKRLYKRECDRLGVIPIGAYLRNPCKSELILNYYCMGADGAKALAIPLMLDSHLVKLDLEGNDINVQGMAGIGEMLIESVTIKELNLSRNSLGHHGASIIKSLLLKNRFIESLSVSGNGFTDVDSSIFADILKENKSLKKLNLSNNSFGDESGNIFGNALAINETLYHLDLSWNKLRGKSAAQLGLSLKENVGLKYFNIAFNGYGRDGAIAISMVLGYNANLLEIDLTDNRLRDVDAITIINQLSNNDTLKIIRLGDNLLTDTGCLDILRLLVKIENSTIEVIDLKNTNVNKEFLQELDEYKSSSNKLPSIQHGPCPRVQTYNIIKNNKV